MCPQGSNTDVAYSFSYKVTDILAVTLAYRVLLVLEWDSHAARTKHQGSSTFIIETFLIDKTCKGA